MSTGSGGADRVERLLRAKGVGRFQVMALLQAARYYLLRDGSLEEAKSWGLSRAVFYAWAKHYGPARRPMSLRELEERAAKRRGGSCPEGMVRVLGECVERSRKGLYVYGGEEMTPSMFDRQVVARLRGLVDWEKAWRAALEYLGRFPRRVLEDPQLFYRLVYEPVRDTFFRDLLLKGRVEPPRWALERAEKYREPGKTSGLDRWLGGGSTSS